MPSIGAVHRDWETVTPADGPWLDWDGEQIYGVMRHETIEKSTPTGVRRFEIAFYDPPSPRDARGVGVSTIRTRDGFCSVLTS